jgi:hypothetical protein
LRPGTPWKSGNFRGNYTRGPSKSCVRPWKKMIGKPYSGKLNERFDEGELEIEPLATTPVLYSAESVKFEGWSRIFQSAGELIFQFHQPMNISFQQVFGYASIIWNRALLSRILRIEMILSPRSKNPGVHMKSLSDFESMAAMLLCMAGERDEKAKRLRMETCGYMMAKKPGSICLLKGSGHCRKPIDKGGHHGGER